MRRSLWFPLLLSLGLLLGPFYFANAEVDLRYMSSEELQAYYAKKRSQNQKSRSKPQQKVSQRRVHSQRPSSVRDRTARTSSQTRRSPSSNAQNSATVRRQRLERILAEYEALGGQGAAKARAIRQVLNNNQATQRSSSQTSRSPNAAAARRRQAPAKQTAARRVASNRPIKDTMTRLSENLPTQQKQVSDLLGMVSHISNFYHINSGATVRDLMKDDHFKKLYKEMGESDSKEGRNVQRATFLYLKGIYEGSDKARKDLEAQGLENLSALKLDRSFSPNINDIESFNEISAIQSNLARRLRGVYDPIPKSDEDGATGATE